jgi:hypothetical protein
MLWYISIFIYFLFEVLTTNAVITMYVPGVIQIQIKYIMVYLSYKIEIFENDSFLYLIDDNYEDCKKKVTITNHPT